jgi:hypothetical protein
MPTYSESPPNNSLKMDPVVRENVAALNRRLQAIQAVAKDGEENEPLRKLVCRVCL